jgi:hypothetical protein
MEREYIQRAKWSQHETIKVAVMFYFEENTRTSVNVSTMWTDFMLRRSFFDKKQGE